MILANKDNRLADQSYDFSGDSKTLAWNMIFFTIKIIKGLRTLRFGGLYDLNFLMP